MKNLLLALILLFPFLSISQNKQVYEVHEVDSVAIPRGGYSYLTTFINANLQIPYMAKVAKVNGYVSLAGVVDEQGKISYIEVIKGVRPDCDKEAVRVFGLFNAWQAGLKGGNKIKQKISFRIPFKSMEAITFVNGMQLQYYDDKYAPTKDSSAYRYVQKTQIDTLTGNSINSINFFEIKRKNKETPLSSFIPKKSEEFEYSLSYPDPFIDSTLKLYNTNHRTLDDKIVGYSMDFFTNGTLYRKQFYVDGKPTYPEIKYYKNGVVRELTENIDIEKGSYKTTNWYPNGQISSVIQYEQQLSKASGKNTMGYMIPVPLVINQWDDSGNQVVKNGEGEAFSIRYADKFSIVTEKGKISNFQKEGIWLEIKEDGTIGNKEIYKDGNFVKGVNYLATGDSTIYNLKEEQPEFKGGMQGFGSFLTNNLRYPLDAQHSSSQGKVYVQFVVCTDGTLCDYKVLKSAGHPSLDKEAVRVLQKSSGQWKPGIQRGTKVRSRFTIPINFALSR
jgi:TonB family protein